MGDSLPFTDQAGAGNGFAIVQHFGRAAQPFVVHLGRKRLQHLAAFPGQPAMGQVLNVVGDADFQIGPDVIRCGGGKESLGPGWKRRWVYFMRNLLCRVARSHQSAVRAAVKTTFAEKERDTAHKRWRKVADGLCDRFPDVAMLMDEVEHGVLAYMAFNGELCRKLHSMNPLERLSKEIKGRAGAVGIFPNREVVIRLVGVLMVEQNDEWAVSWRYMSMETLNQICNGEDGAAMIAAAE